MAFCHDLTARGLGTPLLVIGDGNPGLWRAVKEVFPGVRRQRCQVHKLRNILAKLPKLAAIQLKPLLQQVFLAPDHATGLRRGRALIARFRARYPAAMECLEKDLEECLTYLCFPTEHQKRLRTTNLLDGADLRGLPAPDEGRAALPRRAELSHARVRDAPHGVSDLARDPDHGEDPPALDKRRPAAPTLWKEQAVA